MVDPLRRHKYAFNRILIPAARILSPEFNAVYIFLTGSHVEILRNLLDYANRQHTFVDEYHDGYYISPDDTDWALIRLIVAELELMLMGTVLGFYDAYVCVRDKKALGVQGGTFTAGAWRTRDINDEQADAAGLASIAANQISLAPGTYRCFIVLPCYQTKETSARLYNITDTETTLLGTSIYLHNSTYVGGYNFILGRFTLADTKVLEVQHYGNNTVATFGFGTAGAQQEEVYTSAEFWKEV